LTKVSDDGAVALPEHVRQRLTLGPGDPVAISIRGDGTVVLRPVRCPTADSLAGAAGSLAQRRSSHETREIAAAPDGDATGRAGDDS